MKKIVPLSLTALLLLPNGASVRDTNSAVGASFSWSPYTWSATSYTSSTDSNSIVGAFNNIKFNSSATSRCLSR
jgi:hypothetical protein